MMESCNEVAIRFVARVGNGKSNIAKTVSGEIKKNMLNTGKKNKDYIFLKFT